MGTHHLSTRHISSLGRLGATSRAGVGCKWIPIRSLADQLLQGALKV